MPKIHWPDFRFGPVNLHSLLDAYAFYRLRRQRKETDARQPGCRARQYSDQMHCPDCRLTWDINDPDEPPCAR